MPDRLIYETSDPEFADRAIESLRAAGIDCYRTGRGVRQLNASSGRWTDDQVCLYVRDGGNFQRANEILISLGAAVDEPLRLPKPWVFALAAAILVVVVVLSLKA
jgi:hypothetical protein